MPINSKGAIGPLIIIVVLAVVAFGGYFLISQKGSIPTPSSSGGGGPALTQRATEKDFDFTNDSTLKKHFVAQANQTSYRTKGTGSGSGLTIVNEVQIKSNSFSSREIQSDGTKELKHSVTIGDTVYLKDYADNKWWKQTTKPEKQKEAKEENKAEPKDFKEEYSKPNLTFKALGKEACGPPAGGLSCFKYEEIFPESPELKRIFWFDDKDYLLRKDQAGFGEFIGVVEYSYDGINIQAPSPTKDVPEGKSIYEYSSGSDAKLPAAPTTNQVPPQIPSDLNMDEPNSEDTGE